jgi:hypothetical protein
LKDRKSKNEREREREREVRKKERNAKGKHIFIPKSAESSQFDLKRDVDKLKCEPAL